MGLFKGVRNTISNISQIIVVVILLPFVTILLGAISGPHNGAISSSGMISTLIGNIPLCEVWIDIFYQYSCGISTEDVLSSALFVVLKAFPEALISSICVHACVTIAKKIKVQGLPIFATFIGIAIATIITSLTGLSDNVIVEALIDFGVIIVIFIGIRIALKSVFPGLKIFSVKQILLFVVDGFFAVITTAYISNLILTSAGVYVTTGQAIVRICILTGVEIIVAVGVGIINELAEKDTDVF